MMEPIPNSPISEQVQALLADAIQVSPDMITPDLAFGDLPQWDSLGHMEVMMRLEEQFDVEINPDTIAELISIPDICTYLENNHRG
jgi:acyl carrier protein